MITEDAEIIRIPTLQELKSFEVDTMRLIKNELTIRNKIFWNRLVLPPTATNRANADGTVTQELVDYYDRLTGDEVFSTVILEHSYVEEIGRSTSHQFSMADADKAEGLSEIVQVLHKNHTLAVAQLNHAGAKGLQPEQNKAPSAIDTVIESKCKVKYLKAARGVEKSEIQEIVNKFVQAAVVAKNVGFDGIELHSAHGFLLNQFYSPYTNKRTDEYGGSLENRLRIHTEILNTVRGAVGENFLIFLRLGAVDFLEGGSTLQDAVAAAKILEQNGVDVLDISGGLQGYTRPGHNEAGYFSDITSKIKESVSVPVILTGGIKHLQEAEEQLEANNADFIGIARAALSGTKRLRKEFTEIA